MLEEVSIFVRLFCLLVDQWNHGANFIVPDVFLKHEILILADFLYLSQDVSAENLVELCSGMLVTSDNVVPFLLGLLF